MGMNPTLVASDSPSSSIAASMAVSPTSRRRWNVALWIAQGLLALAFFYAGSHKLITTTGAFSREYQLAIPIAFSEGLFKLIGLAELAGALGVIVPSITRIWPRVTIAAALGLLTVMILAIGFHLGREELSRTPGQFVLGGLSLLVAWGRSSKSPIVARSNEIAPRR